jgi:hypothetical protein
MNKLKPHQPGATRNLSIGAFSILFLLTSCTISLAPKFDQRIMDGLSGSSAEIFQLIAEVSGGTDSSSFSKREEKYNRLIGKIDALELEIRVRPMPANKKTERLTGKVNETLQKRGLPALVTAGDTAPSATALTQIAKHLLQMKNTDRTSGLMPATVELHKGFIRLYLDQALTYERFLKR